MPYIDELTGLCGRLGCRIIPNCSLSEYVTFKFGGPCRALISVNSVYSITELLRFFRAKNIKYGVIGRGSNIIALDRGFDGVILMFGGDFSSITTEGTRIKCDAGALLAAACVNAQQYSLSGMEGLFGIPGTMGGALYMNAGAYGCEMSDVVVSAEYIDGDCNLRSMPKDEMDLSYRHSIFSETDSVIVSVTIELKEGDGEAIRAKMSDCMKKRSEKQPLEYPSAGSIFKRPEGCYASQLVDECGLKGMTCGGAMVSEKHSGFIINRGYATSSDVLELCDKVRKIVKEKTGYELELEPVILE